MTNKDKAKQISCDSILSDYGYAPIKKGGSNFYYSPWRQENNRSLVVYPNNRWADFGENTKTQDSIALYGKLHNLRFSDSIKAMLGKDFETTEIKEEPVREPGVLIHDISDITDPQLTSYLKERKINPKIANIYCKQLRVSFPKSKNPDRKNNVIGFKNDQGGWEMRSSRIKLSNSPKSFTRLLKGSSTCIVNEGFFDFLSLLVWKGVEEVDYDVFVYNSTSFLEQSIPILKRYSAVYLFMDNDNAGKRVAEELKKNGIWVRDFSGKYGRFNDVNEFLKGK